MSSFSKFKNGNHTIRKRKFLNVQSYLKIKVEKITTALNNNLIPGCKTDEKQKVDDFDELIAALIQKYKQKKQI